MTWYDTAGNTPPHEPLRVQAHSIEEPDDQLAVLVVEYRCEWCFGYLPADGLCRCPSSLRDLEQARLEMELER